MISVLYSISDEETDEEFPSNRLVSQIKGAEQRNLFRLHVINPCTVCSITTYQLTLGLSTKLILLISIA